MQRVALILGISLVLLPGPVFAQTQPAAKKVNEFGIVGHCDLTARLDYLAIDAQQDPEAKVYVLVYAPNGDGPGTAKNWLRLLKGYLVETRGLEPERVKTINGGRNSNLHEPKTELWLVPKGARPPKPEKHETDVETFKGFFADWETGDDLGVDVPNEMGVGMGSTTAASFVDILEQQKTAVGYILTYNGEDATPGAWRRVAERQMDHFKWFQLDANRIKIIFGGQQKSTTIQLWIMPANAPPPVADAGAELPLARAVKSGAFYTYDLSSKENQAGLFTRLTKILREYQTVRAFIVVRIEQPAPVEQTEVPETPEIPATDYEPPTEPIEDFEPADLIKLVEKWRSELVNTHKIGADRFIVVFTTAGENESGMLKLWIVPKGQPLPDPKADDEEVQEEAAPSVPASNKRPQR